MDKVFKVGLLLGVAALTLALFQHSQNGRYQFATHGDQGVLIDTRTGKYWTEDGTKFEPLTARITAHHPFVVDSTGDDDRIAKYKNCLLDIATGIRKDPCPIEPSSSAASHPSTDH